LVYLNIVHIGRATGEAGAQHQKRNLIMSIQMNRILDVLVSFAIVALGLTLAGATAAVSI